MKKFDYWRRVLKEALQATLVALGFDSAERVVLRILGSIVSIALIFGLVGAVDANKGLTTALIAGLTILLIFPLTFAIKLITIPAKLDAGLRNQLQIFTDEQEQRTERQNAIDDLAEEINWATQDLVNPDPHPLREGAPSDAIARWRAQCDEWFGKISKKLSNRQFFTRAQQLHFDVLTKVDQVVSIGNMEFGHYYNILHTKISRLRDIIEQVAATNRRAGNPSGATK